MQDLGKGIISRPRIRIISASMEYTPAHVRVSGANGNIEAGTGLEAGAGPGPDADENEEAL